MKGRKNIMVVASWNMQGAGAKKLSSIDIRKGKSPEIILCQETGNPNGDKNAFTQYNSYFTHDKQEYICVSALADPVAIALRCTVAILVKREVIDKVKVETPIQDLSKRPILIVNYEGYTFLTTHVVAEVNDKKRKSQGLSVTELKKNLDEIKKCGMKKWIMMGDFNCSPHEVDTFQDTSLDVKTDTAKLIRYGGSVYRPLHCHLLHAGATQGAGGKRENIYDYAIWDENMVLNYVHLDNCVQIDACNNNILSDHNMIKLEFKGSSARE